MLAWLVQVAVGPALVSLPVTWTATDFAGAARRWFMRLRHKDSLSRIVRAATIECVGLTDAEFDAVRHLLEAEETWNEIGGGTVEDLAALITVCLPPRDDRSLDDSRVISRTIARGLLAQIIHAGGWLVRDGG